jgi:hypothetical protein
MRDPNSTTYNQGNRRYRVFDEDDEALFFWRNFPQDNVALSALFLPLFHEDYNRYYSQYIDILTIPSEWTPKQLYEAGLHTLNVQESLNSIGYDLKDASAWNIVFVKNKPFFCDHGSIIKLKSTQWWGFGQFIRNFIFPMMAFNIRKIIPRDIFTIRRDGLSHIDIKNYGIKFYNTSPIYWPLFLQVKNKAEAISEKNKNKFIPLNELQRSRKIINKYLTKLLIKYRPKNNESTLWSGYESQRDHYSIKDLEFKKNYITQSIKLINKSNINSILDLGCNNGEFLAIASSEIQGDKKLFGVDIDYLSLDNSRKKIVELDTAQIDFDNIINSGGALGDEFNDIWHRIGKFDLVMILAVVHHMHISSSIPLSMILHRLSNITSQYLIFEAIYKTDKMASLLAKQRMRGISYMTKKWYENEFFKYFNVVSSMEIINGDREIFILKKK